MAILINKEPQGIYPAYNDSYIEFSSDLANNNKAEITVDPVEIFIKPFLIYPDPDGKYLFNLKESVKVIFNQSRFKDSSVFTDAYGKNIDGVLLEQDITIKVLSDIAEEEVNKTYDFFKAVKQIGENVHGNEYQLLSYSPDGIIHNLTYFEGFPFHFDIQKVDLADGNITIKNLNTGLFSTPLTPISTGSYRINIDKGNGGNWNSDNILQITEGLNRLEIYANGLKSNIDLTKKIKCSGVYLKWFNRSGGYSHHLFSEFATEQTKGKDEGFVLNSAFENIQDKIGNFENIGKISQSEIIITSQYSQDEYENLRDIIKSPHVQIYTSTEPDVAGKFIDVAIKGNLNHRPQREFNKIALTVIYDEITAKL